MKTIGYPLAMLACLAFSFNSSAQTVSGQIDGYDYVDLMKHPELKIEMLI